MKICVSLQCQNDTESINKTRAEDYLFFDFGIFYNPPIFKI